MLSCESKHATLARLLDKHKQAGCPIIFAERLGTPIRSAPPKRDKSARFGRSIASRPDMPHLVIDPDRSRLVVTALHLRNHHAGKARLGRITLKRPEPHPVTLPSLPAPPPRQNHATVGPLNIDRPGPPHLDKATPGVIFGDAYGKTAETLRAEFVRLGLAERVTSTASNVMPLRVSTPIVRSQFSHPSPV